MGENKHFVVQNAVNGLVLVLFGFLGLWLVDGPSAETLAANLLSSWETIGIVLVSPALGMTVQGISLFAAYLLAGHPYKGDARALVAERVRTTIRSLDRIPESSKAVLLAAPDDSLFVWLYYSVAPEHLIEWARRRRDFQHLGDNWLIATSVGVIGGAIVGKLGGLALLANRRLLVSVIMSSTILWCIGLLYLRRRMKRDADAMELMWACAQLYPTLPERLRSQASESAEARGVPNHGIQPSASGRG